LVEQTLHNDIFGENEKLNNKVFTMFGPPGKKQGDWGKGGEDTETQVLEPVKKLPGNTDGEMVTPPVNRKKEKKCSSRKLKKKRGLWVVSKENKNNKGGGFKGGERGGGPFPSGNYEEIYREVWRRRERKKFAEPIAPLGVEKKRSIEYKNRLSIWSDTMAGG